MASSAASTNQRGSTQAPSYHPVDILLNGRLTRVLVDEDTHQSLTSIAGEDGTRSATPSARHLTSAEVDSMQSVLSGGGPAGSVRSADGSTREPGSLHTDRSIQTNANLPRPPIPDRPAPTVRFADPSATESTAASTDNADPGRPIAAFLDSLTTYLTSAGTEDHNREQQASPAHIEDSSPRQEAFGRIDSGEEVAHIDRLRAAAGVTDLHVTPALVEVMTTPVAYMEELLARIRIQSAPPQAASNEATAPAATAAPTTMSNPLDPSCDSREAARGSGAHPPEATTMTNDLNGASGEAATTKSVKPVNIRTRLRRKARKVNKSLVLQKLNQTERQVMSRNCPRRDARMLALLHFLGRVIDHKSTDEGNKQTRKMFFLWTERAELQVILRTLADMLKYAEPWWEYVRERFKCRMTGKEMPAPEGAVSSLLVEAIRDGLLEAEYDLSREVSSKSGTDSRTSIRAEHKSAASKESTRRSRRRQRLRERRPLVPGPDHRSASGHIVSTLSSACRSIRRLLSSGLSHQLPTGAEVDEAISKASGKQGSSLALHTEDLIDTVLTLPKALQFALSRRSEATQGVLKDLGKMIQDDTESEWIDVDEKKQKQWWKTFCEDEKAEGSLPFRLRQLPWRKVEDDKGFLRYLNPAEKHALRQWRELLEAGKDRVREQRREDEAMKASGVGENGQRERG